jgi:hypothetical protein
MVKHAGNDMMDASQPEIITNSRSGKTYHRFLQSGHEIYRTGRIT